MDRRYSQSDMETSAVCIIVQVADDLQLTTERKEQLLAHLLEGLQAQVGLQVYSGVGGGRGESMCLRVSEFG